MEEVIEKMETALVSLEPKDGRASSFEGLYKNWGKNDSQEERRKELLEIQKSNRNKKIDIYRGIIDLINSVEETNKIFHSNRKVPYRPNIYVSGFNKAPSTYRNILMMSEWMIEKPSDLSENWYVTPCPKGSRVLVIANQGRTKCYSKYGCFKFEKHSALPGGNNIDHYKDACCVLDCFYQEKNDTMYVLDFLAWNNQPMTECETEFRNYWLQSQFSENQDIGVVNKKNKIKFSLLPKVPCTPEELNKFMMTYPHFEKNSPGLDGLLFYHKKAHYVSGETPLVGWLFPYMVPEVLGADITVHEHYMLQKPVGYVNQAEFIQKFDEKHSKKKSRSRHTSRSSMDTTDIVKNEMEAEHSALLEVKPTTMEAEESSEVTKDKNALQDSLEVKPTTMEAEESSEVTKDKSVSQDSLEVKPTTMEAEESSEVTKDKNASQDSLEVKPTTMEAEESSAVTKDKSVSQDSLKVKPSIMEAEESLEVTIDKKEISNECQKLSECNTTT